MFKNVKWLRLTPDRPGRGGTKTGIHTFQQEPVNDVRSFYGGHVYQGAWRREFASVAYPAVQALPAGGSQPLSLHGYVYPSLTDPSATPNVTVLSHQTEGAGPGSYVRDVATGAIRVGPRPTTATPAVFQNINGRCFIGEGTGEGAILDDRTPVIHAQPNQNLGIGTPTQSLGPVTIPATAGPNVFLGSVVPNVVPYGTAYIQQDTPYINHPNPNNPLGTILATDTVTVGLLDPNMTSIYSISAFAAGASPTVDAVTSNTIPFTATGTIQITSGTSLVTLSGAVWPALGQYIGLSINFNGYSFVVQGHGSIGVPVFDLDGNPVALSNVQLLILGVYNGPDYTGPYTITGCQVTMGGGWPAANNAATVNTAPGAIPPGFALGYSQSTTSSIVQIMVQAIRANGLYRNLGNIDLGPVGALRLHVIHDGNMPKDSFILNSASGNFTPADVGSTIIVDGADTGVGSLLVTTISAYKSSSQVWLVDQNGTGGIVANALAVWGPKIIGISDATMGAASTTLTSVSNPWSEGNIGDTIIIAAAGLGGKALLTTIVGFTNAGQVTLQNASVGAVTTVQAYWQDILAGTTTGPTYAYAWYDPETGHCSNISPMFQIAAPKTVGTFSDFSNLTPVFAVDPGSISYPNQATDGIRFSHVLFFRTLSTVGASTLYPIGSLQPFVGKVHPGGPSTRGSWNPSTFHGWFGIPNNYLSEPVLAPNTTPNYWYDFSSDEDLLLAGGFRAPQETNEKPIVLLRGGATQPGHPYAMAYWDRRLWIANTQDPAVIQFSCDDAQCPLGIPEESFPPKNVLTLPSVDGRVIGMRTVGDMLLVTTEKWAYIIVGNNESNYRLMKASSSMPGVGMYQMDEFPTYTGAEGEPTTLFYLGRDRKVYQWTMGGPTTPISGPIQDQLDAELMGHPFYTPLIEYQFSRLHCVSAWGRRLVIVAPNGIEESPTLGPSQVHVYDIDNQVWSETFHTNSTQHAEDGLAPMTTIYGLDIPVNEIYSIYDPNLNQTIVRSWLRDDTTGTPNYMTIQTFPMNFDGKKTRKQIVAMNLHATGGSWTGGIFVNEATAALAASFGPYPDLLYSIYAPISSPFDPGAQDIVIMAAQFTPPAPVVGYNFSFVVQKNADQNPATVYALDVAYVDYEKSGEGDV